MADAVELSQALANSEKVRECFAGRWFTDAVGADLGDLGDCARDEVLTAFRDSGDVRELIVTILVSDNFRFLNTQGEQ